jgi:uncharacterized protein
VSPEQALERELLAESAVRFALLFGSRADATARPDSDWDVGVYLDPALDAHQRLELRLRLSAALAPGLVLDTVILNDAPALLAHRALRGRLLLKRDARAYVRFFVRILGAAEDERYYREVHRAARERRLREGHFGRP